MAHAAILHRRGAVGEASSPVDQTPIQLHAVLYWEEALLARFMLMNKNRAVLAFEYDLETHTATHITEVVDAARAPLGLFDERGGMSKRDTNYWWRHRSIPASREQVERLLENLRLDSTLELAERSFGLSLSDRYWIDDLDASQRWDDITFFDHDFSDDLGILTLGQDGRKAHFSGQVT